MEISFDILFGSNCCDHYHHHHHHYFNRVKINKGFCSMHSICKSSAMSFNKAILKICNELTKCLTIMIYAIFAL